MNLLCNIVHVVRRFLAIAVVTQTGSANVSAMNKYRVAKKKNQNILYINICSVGNEQIPEVCYSLLREFIFQFLLENSVIIFAHLILCQLAL